MTVLPTVCAHAIPDRPSPPQLVNDFAGILSRAQEIALERKLTAFSDSTSNQIAVVTVSDLEGYSAAEYGTEIGMAWQVGSAKFDNGIVVLVKPKTELSRGEVNISVGYGLEGAIPDSYAKRIITNEMIPLFSQGNYYSGIDKACTVLMQLASGEISEPDGGRTEAEDIIFGIGGWLLLVALIIIAGRGRRGGGGKNRRNQEDTWADDGDFIKGLIIGDILGNVGRGGYSRGGFGSGGFGGFGGFGGGSFGGGGASGSW